MLTGFKHGPSKCQQNGQWQKTLTSCCNTERLDVRLKVNHGMRLRITLSDFNYFESMKHGVLRDHLGLSKKINKEKKTRVKPWETKTSQSDNITKNEEAKHGQISRPSSLITHPLSKNKCLYTSMPLLLSFTQSKWYDYFRIKLTESDRSQSFFSWHRPVTFILNSLLHTVYRLQQ